MSNYEKMRAGFETAYVDGSAAASLAYEMNNAQIRNDIETYVKANGPQDTRNVISVFAAKYSTTRQRISGNISHMVCRDMTATITTGASGSVMYC